MGDAVREHDRISSFHIVPDLQRTRSDLVAPMKRITTTPLPPIILDRGDVYNLGGWFMTIVIAVVASAIVWGSWFASMLIF